MRNEQGGNIMDKVEDMWIGGPHKKINDVDDYVSWFDNSRDYKNNYSKGYIDFYNRVLTLDMYKHIGDPREKTCLEIGFGGGRLLNASSRIFNRAYGVDILNDECINMTKSLLEDNGRDNIVLYNKKDIEQISDKTIDFVYSFVVFQHFSNWGVVEFYLDFIDRVLSDTGVGILYFGRNNYNADDYYCVDDPEDRGMSLLVNPEFAENQLSEWFGVVEVGSVTKQPWNDDQSSQFYIKFVR
jgi:ubiquinone/menaquinone biosynthesis C-methylase UbiE